MKIEEGKRYIRRDNTITPPMELYCSEFSGINVVFDPEHNWLYNNSEEFGHLVFGKSKREHSHDLIEEFKEK